MDFDDQLYLTWDILDTGEGVRYFAKRGRDIVGRLAPSFSHFVRAAHNLDDWNFYVTLNPTRTSGVGSKASSRDVLAWRFVLIDVDPVEQGADSFRALEKILDQGASLLGYPTGLHHRTAVINSGRGHQAWLAIDQEDITSTQRYEIERATNYFLRKLDTHSHGCRIDTSCSDLSRVARCPGTINTKTGQRAFFQWHWPWPQEEIATISAAEILGFAPLEIQIPRREIEQGATITEILPALTMRAAAFLTEGIISPGRHAGAYATAASLREAGVERSLAEEMVRAGARLCTPPMNEAEAVRAVKQAYNREPPQ